MGPRVHDMELQHIVDIVLGAQAGGYSFEAGNPPRKHDWRVWETVRPPQGKLPIPGIITQDSNLVEHTEAVAQRIGRFAAVVGRENVIAPIAALPTFRPRVQGSRERRLDRIGGIGRGLLARDERIVGRGPMGRRSQREQ
jgi:hypothetical protein